MIADLQGVRCWDLPEESADAERANEGALAGDSGSRSSSKKKAKHRKLNPNGAWLLSDPQVLSQSSSTMFGRADRGAGGIS